MISPGYEKGLKTLREASRRAKAVIARRAYFIWVRNGRLEGTALKDWVQAEDELGGAMVVVQNELWDMDEHWDEQLLDDGPMGPLAKFALDEDGPCMNNREVIEEPLEGDYH